MEKICEKKLEIGKIFYKGDLSTIYKLKDGKLYKKVSSFTTSFNIIRENFENKILLSDEFRGIDGINLPLQAVYDDYGIVGYTMKYISGVPILKYSLNIDEKDIRKLTDLYLKIESIVKNANENGIIIPDLGTYGNILVLKNGKVILTDYDGMQVNNLFAPGMSTMLGEQGQYNIPKYKSDSELLLFKDNLDKKSLILSYILLLLNLRIEDSKILFKGLSSREYIDLACKHINLTNTSLIEKLYNVYDDNKDNDYITEEVKEIAKNNKIVILGRDPMSGVPQKKLKLR